MTPTIPYLKEPLYSADEVAHMLGVSRQTILRQAKSKKSPIPCIVVGNNYRFFMSDILKYFSIDPSKVVIPDTADASRQLVNSHPTQANQGEVK